jgi:hypothetical protein
VKGSNFQSTTHLKASVDTMAEVSEPLLKQQQVSSAEMGHSTPIALSFQSLVCGWVIGLFIQLSTLNANYSIISVWDDDESARISSQDLLARSLVWSVGISLVGGFLVALLRWLSVVPMAGIEHVGMECRLVIGTLLGVCVAWLATDIVIGVRAQIIYSTAILLLSMGWCSFIVFVSTKAEPRIQSLDTGASVQDVQV